MCKIKNILLAGLALLFTGSIAFADDINEDLVYKISFSRAADVEILLAKKADPNTKNASGIPVIFMAAGRADDQAPEIVAALIKAGANIYATNAQGVMPIIEAVRVGNAQNVKLLIDNGAVLSVRDQIGNDLPSIAQARGDKSIIQYVNAGLAAERTRLSGLKNSNSLTKLVQKYSFYSCANFYLKYYKRDNPAKTSDENFKAIIDKNEADSKDVEDRLTSLFELETKDFSYIRSESTRLLKDKLDSMLTNENRLYNSFGTNDDLNAKCKTIAKNWDGSRFAYKYKDGKKVVTEYK